MLIKKKHHIIWTYKREGWLQKNFQGLRIRKKKERGKDEILLRLKGFFNGSQISVLLRMTLLLWGKRCWAAGGGKDSCIWRLMWIGMMENQKSWLFIFFRKLEAGQYLQRFVDVEGTQATYPPDRISAATVEIFSTAWSNMVAMRLHVLLGTLSVFCVTEILRF